MKRAVLLLLVLGLVPIGCKSDEPSVNDAPPQKPPVMKPPANSG